MVIPSHIQGFCENLAHCARSIAPNASDVHLPLIFHNGQQIPFRTALQEYLGKQTSTESAMKRNVPERSGTSAQAVSAKVSENATSTSKTIMSLSACTAARPPVAADMEMYHLASEGYTAWSSSASNRTLDGAQPAPLPLLFEPPSVNLLVPPPAVRCCRDLAVLPDGMQVNTTASRKHMDASQFVARSILDEEPFFESVEQDVGSQLDLDKASVEQRGHSFPCGGGLPSAPPQMPKRLPVARQRPLLPEGRTVTSSGSGTRSSAPDLTSPGMEDLLLTLIEKFKVNPLHGAHHG